MNRLLIPIQDAVIERGQRAWTRIKATAAEQRQLWREVGEALNYGRAMHPSNQAFGKWLKDNGFDMDPTTRNDAMWWATASLDCLNTDAAHPTLIRKAHRDTQAPALAPEDTATDETLAAIAKVDPVKRKVNALAAHAAGTGPEAETAQRQLKKIAAAKDMTVESMVSMAEKLEPLSKYPPAHRERIRGYLNGLDEFAKLMRGFIDSTDGVITDEFIIAFFVAQLNGRRTDSPGSS